MLQNGEPCARPVQVCHSPKIILSPTPRKNKRNSPRAVTMGDRATNYVPGIDFMKLIAVYLISFCFSQRLFETSLEKKISPMAGGFLILQIGRVFFFFYKVGDLLIVNFRDTKIEFH